MEIIDNINQLLGDNFKKILAAAFKLRIAADAGQAGRIPSDGPTLNSQLRTPSRLALTFSRTQ